MNEPWIDELRNEVDVAAERIAPTIDFRDQLRIDLIDEWNGRPIVERSTHDADGDARRPRRGWLLAAAAATVALLGGLVVATRPDDRVVTPTPATEPDQPTPTSPVIETPATTAVTVPNDSTVPTSTPLTTIDTPTDRVLVVPLDPTTPVAVESIATVEYGTGPNQIEVLNGEFPPPAIQYIGGYLVLEDAPQSGLTGRGLIVEGGTGDVVQEVTFDGLEPGGTPLGVRSLDGGGVVIATIHDEAPRVRVRQYMQNPPGVFNSFGEGADIEALGDGRLEITSAGATWDGELVIASEPSVARAQVGVSDPFGGPAQTYVVTRPIGDGTTTAKWTLDVIVDEVSPPGSDTAYVEPFGDGVLFSAPNSSARDAQAPLVLLRSDFTADVYDLDGWSIADVRPDGALLTRSAPDGLELGLLRPAATAGPESFASPLADWPASATDLAGGTRLADMPYLLPAVDPPAADVAYRSEFESELLDNLAYRQSWVAADGSGYLVIATDPDRPDLTPPESRTPVDVPGWDDAYQTRTADGFVSIVLVDGSGHVGVRVAGFEVADVLRVARTLERVGDGEPGWTFDMTGPLFDQLTPFGASGTARTAFRSLLWKDTGGEIVAQIDISSNTDETLAGTFPFSPTEGEVTIGDVMDREAIVVRPVGTDKVVIAWPVSPEVAVRLGYIGTVDDALAFARSIAVVDEAAWTQATAVDSTPRDGCDSLFC